MKKNILFLIILLSCLSINAQEEGDALVSVAKINWMDTDEYYFDFYYSDGNPVEKVDEGLAITNSHLYDHTWDCSVPILVHFSLEKGHNYIVRITMKVPSDATYNVGMGSWDGRGVWASRDASVIFDHSFQIVDVEYPEYQDNIYGDGMVFLGIGRVVGTTVVQEVEVLEKTPVDGIQNVKPSNPADDVRYNLAGQKVAASYKGIVIQNGRKIVK